MKCECVENNHSKSNSKFGEKNTNSGGSEGLNGDFSDSDSDYAEFLLARQREEEEGEGDEGHVEKKRKVE